MIFNLAANILCHANLFVGSTVAVTANDSDPPVCCLSGILQISYCTERHSIVPK